MAKRMTIGEAAKQSGLSVKAIRFLRRDGTLSQRRREARPGTAPTTPPTCGACAFLRRLRLLGVPLAEVGPLLRSAATADCADFAVELGDTFAAGNELRSRNG